MHTKTHALLTAFLLVLCTPFTALSQGAPSAGATSALFSRGAPFEQTMVITAYYSPQPEQCCYVRGTLAGDIALNGGGIRSADGTGVYAGMAAAPPSYPFGTRIALPGIGVVTVHDRGGAIQEWNDAHRLDLWVGSGEEGLARALAFGVQRVRATVYPLGSAAPGETMDLSALPSPPEKLKPYMAEGTTLLHVQARAGDRTASVQFLQRRLQTLGYFDEQPTGFYGPATQASLQRFYRDMDSPETADALTDNGAAVIEAAFARRTAKDPVAGIVDARSAPARIMDAQRTLRFLDAYDGRTSGVYDDTFRTAVLTFQKEQGIVSGDSAPGAGRIGPQTRAKIVLLWRRAHAKRGSARLLAARRIDELIAKRGQALRQFLGKGDRGSDVRALQAFLIRKGYLKDGATGTFGAKTEQALIAYQKDAGIIADDAEQGAGFAGPATLARYHRDLREALLRTVREKGWGAI